MNVLVIGCGLLGRKIARTMDEMGWDVSVLSNIESDLELLENDFEGVTFRGFPMDIRNLREAGIESCDAVAVTTADDNFNITVAQIARDYFGIQNVVARVSDPTRELIFEHMGFRSSTKTIPLRSMSSRVATSAITIRFPPSSPASSTQTC